MESFSLFPEQLPYIILCFSMRKCGQCCCPHDNTVLVEDNCCECNYAAMRKLGQFKNTDMIYVTYHVDVSQKYLFKKYESGDLFCGII